MHTVKAAFEVHDGKEAALCDERLAEPFEYATWCKTTNMVTAVSACFDCSAEKPCAATPSPTGRYVRRVSFLGRSECRLWERRSKGASLGVDRPRTGKTVLP